MATTRARQLIETLQMQRHPEGGWYREVFRSGTEIHPGDERALRPAMTSIYFLLEAGQLSRWHRVRSDELWVHLEGLPLALWTCDAALRTAPSHVRLGPVDTHGTHPQHVVLAGQWQAAQPIAGSGKEHDEGGCTLVACAVAPGFDFADFSLMAPAGDEAAAIRHHWPALAAFI